VSVILWTSVSKFWEEVGNESMVGELLLLSKSAAESIVLVLDLKGKCK
jgi:hypothetical protein